MPSDQGVGRNTYVRGVHHAYNERDAQRQEAFERQWAQREGEWQRHASEMAAQIHADYRQKDLIHERERQQQGRGQFHHDADEKDLLKIKCPSLGDDDAEKDSKIGSKEYLIWKKAVRIWEATTRVHPGQIGGRNEGKSEECHTPCVI